MQQCHFLLQLFLEAEQTDTLSGLCLQCAADKGAHGNSRNFDGVLEREKNAVFRTLVIRHVVDVLTLVQNLTASYGVFRIAHQSSAQCGFSGAVGTHEHMDLIFMDVQIDSVENLLFSSTDFQILNTKQSILTHVFSSPFIILQHQQV